ncbi:MAG: choice-of-anchor J domain-containing protein [Bacteroidaceae bacterium]|nr:choice-of-anchor J domain-containing protein [Bacteroidaceae bacterium]
MKKIYYFFLVLLLTFIGQNALAFDNDQLAKTVDGKDLSTTTTPYVNNCDLEGKYKEMGILNANEDDRTWGLNKSATSFPNDFKYSYNKNNDADDWLITPGIYLLAGTEYTFSMNIKCSNQDYPEKYEVSMGKTPSVNGLNINVLPVEEVKNINYAKKEKTDIIVTESGYYYFGIHCCSVKDQATLLCNNISVKANDESKLPSKVSNLTVTPDADGALKANIQFTMPTKTINGDDLSKSFNCFATIFRNGQTIKTIEGACGANINYLDENGEGNIITNGSYVYSVSVIHNNLSSELTEKTAYIGVDKPKRVTNIKLKDNLTSIHISWDKVDNKSNSGNLVIPDDVTYNVYAVEEIPDFIGTKWSIVGGKALNDSPLSTTSFDYSFNTSQGNEQTLKYFAVRAFNIAGSSKVGDTDPDSRESILIGKPYNSPFLENFSTGGFEHYWTTDKVGNAKISIDPTVSSDKDEYSLLIRSDYNTGKVTLTSGKINISSLSTPAISFDIKGDNGVTGKVHAESADGSSSEVKIFDVSSDFTEVITSISSLGGKDGWVKIIIEVSLPDLINGCSTWIDNIKISDGGDIPDTPDPDIKAMNGNELAKIDVLPYINSCEDATIANTLGTIDANEDKSTWKYSYLNVFSPLNYNTKVCDDWLVTPAIKLEAGKHYRLAFDYKLIYSASDKDAITRLQIFMGQHANLKGMTTAVTDELNFKQDNTSNYDSFSDEDITVDETGYYFFGFHNYSENQSIYIKNIVIDNALDPNKPGVADNISVAPDANGALKATIRFNLPTKKADKTDLDPELSLSAKIYNGENLIATLQGNVGESLSYVDESSIHDNGFVTYSIVVMNGDIAGDKVSAKKTYVGIDIPVAPTDFSASEAIDNTITFNWKYSSNIGINNGYFIPSDLTYDIWIVDCDFSDFSSSNPIYTRISKINSEPIRGNSFEYFFNEEQKTQYFIITANNIAGSSPDSKAIRMITGKLYDLPFTEDFSQEHFTKAWEYENNLSYEFGTSGLESFIKLIGPKYGSTVSKAQLTSGKILINTAINPELTFTVHGDAGTALNVIVTAFDDTKIESIVEDVNDDININLSELADKEGFVRIQFAVSLPKNTSISISNIKVDEGSSAEKYKLNITDKGWASMYLDKAVNIPENVEIYYASAKNGNKITLSKINNVIPAECGVLVKADAGSVIFDYTTTATAIQNNLFLGVTEDTDTPANAYVLSSVANDGTPLFQHYVGSKLKANKVYLLLPDSSIKDIYFEIDETTGIYNVNDNINVNDNYNLSGQRVGNNFRGIIIKNGVKMLRK